MLQYTVMRKLFFLIAFLFTGVVAFSQQRVSADSLRYYEGKVITVCQKITDTFVTKGTEKTTFLNFGNFPYQLFTGIIFQEHLSNFSYDPAERLKGKNVCIVGDVRMMNGSAEIIIEKEEQIQVLD